MGDEETIQKVVVKPDEFSGLIGNIAGNLIRDRVLFSHLTRPLKFNSKKENPNLEIFNGCFLWKLLVHSRSKNICAYVVVGIQLADGCSFVYQFADGYFLFYYLKGFVSFI
ncbi:unnamed protein product [Haemonchus placei]|uniref:CPSF_A domain-containing protein n=1 Tax=Haemonchus placei TaxID=6290 RepID=A0A0N4WA82_HAEPC|nr:unnamed protein product [Haemonchus placei]